jgi:hypothetical protein
MRTPTGQHTVSEWSRLVSQVRARCFLFDLGVMPARPDTAWDEFAKTA